MGKSVLTPEENLLGKAVRQWCGATRAAGSVLALGEREFGKNSETCLWGIEASKQVTTVGPGQSSLWRVIFSL